jgi:DNA recombination protein RmuC
MPTVEVALGICIVVAGVLGVLLGRHLGIGSLKAELGARRENLETVSAERARLEDQASQQSALIQQQREQIARSEERLAAQEQKYTQMKADLDGTFKSVAADALRANTQSFLALAKQELGGQTQEARQTLEQKETAIKTLLDPLSKALTSLDQQTRAMETTRAGAYSEVRTLVQSIQQSIPASLDALRNETSQLVTALRAPKTRGNWGELQLKRCVEYAGMIEYCSFSQQVSARDEDDRLLRPDMTIRMPNGREIVVDAKTPLDAFLDASGNTDFATQKLRFEAHAQRLKTHLKDLSSKAYWRQFEKAPDFVVCFLPSEALFSAALESDPSLIEFGAQNHVVIATPTTLIALLRAVEFGWQQMDITKSAKAIHEVGRRIYEKLVKANEHVTKLGNALTTTVDTYNRFLGSIEGKQGGSVFYLGRQLGELVHSDQEIPEAEKLKTTEVREAESPEWTQPLFPDADAVEEPSLALAAEAESSEESKS